MEIITLNKDKNIDLGRRGHFMEFSMLDNSAA